MTLFDPDPSLRWWFAMTHPDDEISIAVWIRKCVQRGCPVFISWTHSNPIREREGRAVAQLLGVPAENLFFLGATDASVCDEMRKLLPEFRRIVQEVNPTRVCCGAFEQGHLDHDSTNLLVNASFDGPVLEIPFYHTYLTRLQTMNRFSNPSGQEILNLDLDEQRFKKVIARQYPSQNIWSVLLAYEVGQCALCRGMVLSKTERLRLQSATNYLQPKHPPKLAKRVARSYKWGRWRHAVHALERAMADPAPQILAESVQNTNSIRR